ncbi:hypothetical protein J2Z79_003540 [Symbiobacterium terraclitae]|uniref:Lipoprotein n=1 Tax=Symbiobacterium terraclitae TaxID=557451 RepID=A0ABS4JYZ3_9FIRM|nr:hypothetical protein [Symbiobacterium terraclitae]MBP2020086.1 hypothetical protein [Symbiobacterium terraclitae]
MKRLPLAKWLGLATAAAVMAAGCTAQPQNANRLNQSTVFTTTGDNDQCAAALGNTVDTAAYWGGAVTGINRNVTANGLIIGNVALVALPGESQNIPVTGTTGVGTARITPAPAAPRTGSAATGAGQGTGNGIAAGINAQTGAGTAAGVGTDDGMPLAGVTPRTDPTLGDTRIGAAAGTPMTADGSGTSAGAATAPGNRTVTGAGATAGNRTMAGTGTAAGNRTHVGGGTADTGTLPGAGAPVGNRTAAGTGGAAATRMGTGTPAGTRANAGTAARYGAVGSPAVNRLNPVERIRIACPRVADIRVVNDANDRSRLAQITAAVRSGRPITEFMGELTAISQRATSAGPGADVRRLNTNAPAGTRPPGTTNPGTPAPGTTAPGTRTPGMTTPGTPTPGAPTPGATRMPAPGTRAGGTGTTSPGQGVETTP